MRDGRRTKILATLGPSSSDPAILARLVDAGMDGARINLSHGDRMSWLAQAAAVRALEDQLGRPIAVLADLQGPKIRLAPDTERREIAVGEEITIVSGHQTPEGAVAIAWDEVCEAAVPGQSEIVIGDGTPRFVVTARATYQGSPALIAVCERSGFLAPRRGAAVTHVSRNAPALTPKDYADLDVLVELRPDFVALSFVREAADVMLLRSELDMRGLDDVRIVAKIEKAEAMLALEEIIEAADAVMVARGDLGVEMGLAQVPLAQKRILALAGRAGKLSITATQMLESMHTAGEPTRAEASDVANAILDGTSCVMLSGETAQGSYPVESVAAMDEIARAAESLGPGTAPDAPELTDAEAVMKAAALLGEVRQCGCYLVPTATGGSVRALARQRPAAPILALCHQNVVARQLCLEWSVRSVFFAEPDNMDTMIDEALVVCSRETGLADQTPVVMTYGPVLARPGATNLIVLRHLGHEESLGL